MRRNLLLLVTALTFGMLVGVAPVTAKAAAPYQSHPHGQSYSQWLRDIGQFYLGDASNPLFGGLAGDCGELVDGVFFMAAPIDLGVELDCEVPAGTPIVVSHAGWFVTEGIDGDTDAELEAAASAGFVTTTDELFLDGRPVALRPIDTGAYDVVSEPGSFYDAILGVGTGPIRTALRGDIVFLHPLSPGDHVIEGAVEFTNDGAYSVTYHVHVGGR